MEEKDIQKIIREQTENVPIPESLEPENMMKKIEEKAKKKKASRYRKIVAAAASCAIVAGIGIAGLSGAFSRNENLPQVASTGTAQKPLQVASIETAKDYKEIYQLFEQEHKRNKQNGLGFVGAGADMAKRERAEEESADMASAEPQYMGDHSDTNVREEGVGEADIVKTDGNRMYVLNYPKLDIVDISQDRMENLSSIELPPEGWMGELYVKENRLVVVYTISETMDDPSTVILEEDGDTSQKIVADMDPSFYQEYTVAETFDISDPKNPKSIGQIKQSGSFDTVRFVGDYVYLLSGYYPGSQILRDEENTYIPFIQGKMLSSEDIYMPMLGEARKYTVISAYSLQDPEVITDKKAVLGGGEMSYVSKGNIYVTEVEYSNQEKEENYTCIRKVSYEDGTLNGIGQVKVAGILNDSFSIDEYEGTLRMVTTLNESNTLYIFDEKLKELSKIENLAKEERVYSARFMGDTGYFVTFKQIDPLFSVDLKDPKQPKILGELKIPGFSEYLHPYGEGKLLGIGLDVDETGTTTEGVKLSMFDISDPANVLEQQKYVIEGTYSTDVGYNYKVAFVQPEKNLIGFVAYGEAIQYYLFSYDEANGFTPVFERNMMGLPTDVRAFYVGDKFFLVAGNVLESYRLDTFEKIDDLVL